jgi:hypothetical protein
MLGRLLGALATAALFVTLTGGCVVVERRERDNSPPPPPPPSENETPRHRGRADPPPPPEPAPAPAPAPANEHPDMRTGGGPSSQTSGNAWEEPEKCEGQQEVQVPPPANNPADRPYAPPGPNMQWVGGHWEFHGSWQWKAGVWYMAPERHRVWIAGQWAPTGRGTWFWKAGKWKDKK